MNYERKLIVVALFIFIALFSGTLFFHVIEGWRYVDAFYFIGIALTTQLWRFLSTD